MYDINEFLNKVSYNTWQEPKHIKLITKALVKLESRKIKRLIVNIPPRHGKSELISKYFPVWYLINNPDHRVILTSYSNMFSSLWGIQCMELINEFGDYYGIKISKNSRSKSHFRLEDAIGGMTSVGAGGSLTGRGANLIIIDDPIKNNFEARSHKHRDKLWEWLLTTVFTRLEPDGVIVIVMTRWHKDDICGRILNRYEIDLITDKILDV